VLESPSLQNESPTQLKSEVEEILNGSFSWWRSQGMYNHLKLDEWSAHISLINSEDDKDVSEMYRVLDALEAKRKGEQVASP